MELVESGKTPKQQRFALFHISIIASAYLPSLAHTKTRVIRTQRARVANEIPNENNSGSSADTRIFNSIKPTNRMEQRFDS